MPFYPNFLYERKCITELWPVVTTLICFGKCHNTVQFSPTQCTEPCSDGLFIANWPVSLSRSFVHSWSCLRMSTGNYEDVVAGHGNVGVSDCWSLMKCSNSCMKVKWDGQNKLFFRIQSQVLSAITVLSQWRSLVFGSQFFNYSTNKKLTSVVLSLTRNINEN